MHMDGIDRCCRRRWGLARGFHIPIRYALVCSQDQNPSSWVTTAHWNISVSVLEWPWLQVMCVMFDGLYVDTEENAAATNITVRSQTLRL